jgi:hypothetical protein
LKLLCTPENARVQRILVQIKALEGFSSLKAILYGIIGNKLLPVIPDLAGMNCMGR